MIKNDSYIEPSKQIIDEKIKKFRASLVIFCKKKGILENEIFVDDEVLKEVFIRVDKRITYYKVFHNISANEYKETAIMIYWINKLKPLSIIKDNVSDKFKGNKINIDFCIYLLASAIIGFEKLYNFNETAFKNYLDEIRYNLSSRDIGQDALVVALAPFYHFAIQMDEGI